MAKEEKKRVIRPQAGRRKGVACARGARADIKGQRGRNGHRQANTVESRSMSDQITWIMTAIFTYIHYPIYNQYRGQVDYMAPDGFIALQHSPVAALIHQRLARLSPCDACTVTRLQTAYGCAVQSVALGPSAIHALGRPDLVGVCYGRGQPA